MTQDYYIVSGKTRKGPYDMVMLIRKVRNGSLTAATLIQQDENVEPKPAAEWPKLAEFLAEKKDEQVELAKSGQLQHRGLIHALQGGWRFLQRNQISSALAAMWVLCVIAMIGISYGMLPEWAHGPAFMVCFIFSHLLLSFYVFAVLRMTRGQPVSAIYLSGKIVPSLRRLLLSSLFSSLMTILGVILLTNADSWKISMIGVIVVAIPGLFILTLYAFAPLLILDQGYKLWEAMELSRKAVLRSGIENIGVLYALFVINFIAGLFIIVPMAISLPITMGALAEIYDESTF